MTLKKIIACFVLIALSSGACNLPTPATSTVIPLSLQATENRIVLVETPSPLPATVPSTPHKPEPTLVKSGGGGDIPQAGPPFTTAGFEGLPQALLDGLNDGRTSDDLEQALEEAGYYQKQNPFLSGDLDGNGMDDLVVSIIDPSNGAVPPSGALLIYLFKEGGYEITLNQPYPGGPHLWNLKDLDADGRADLVLSQGSCGAHACFEEVNILSWDGISFVSRLDGSSADLPSPTIQAEDPDSDHVYQLDITGTKYGSADAGPARTRTWIWTYDPLSWHWHKTEELLGEPVYRIHMLQDADDSAKNGGFEQALLQYERVIGDSSLQDWADPSLEGANLGAYARYKMFLIYLLQGQDDLAEMIYTELADRFPAGTAQHSYLEMADAFQQGFSNHDLAAGCAEVENYAVAHADGVLAPLNSFGYANPIFIPRDLCL